MSEPKLRRHHLLQKIRCTRCCKEIEGYRFYTYLHGETVCMECFKKIFHEEAIRALRKKVFGEEIENEA